MPVFFNPTTWTPVVLAWSFLLLLPFSRSSELPMFIMAILGGVLIWKHGKQAVWEGGAKTFSLLFLCIWVPMALSVPDSLWFEKSLSTTLTYPRIYLAGIYLIWVLREELPRQRLLKLSAWLLLFWVVDALVQAVVGYNLLGYAYPERLNGLFGPKNWKLGLTLAMLSPIVWEYVSRNGAKWQLGLAWLGTAAVVLLASNRQSWVVFALATLIWGISYSYRQGMRPVRMLAPVVLIAVLAGMAAYHFNPKFAVQVDKTLLAEKLTYEGLNNASSGRLQIWANATRAFLNHPVNGVWVRAYRHAYPLYAPEGDIFVGSDGTGALYAHQVVFEVASESGLFGVAGLLCFYMLLIFAARRVHAGASRLAWPFMVGVLAWWFPLNAHTAIYSAYWSLLLGWVLAVSL
ncbi:MAG: O-antigen ligase family protein, partial [Zoogloea sp.]|nr:O-antigen ligase family protein [Zoogloea sp.]